MKRDNSYSKGRPGVLGAALFGLCPQCGARSLFAAPAQLALACDECQLDLISLEGGGRFTGLVTMGLAAALIMAAIGIDSIWQPPLWLLPLIWVPVTLLCVVGFLRLYKVVWLYAAYDRWAEQRAVSDEGETP